MEKVQGDFCIAVVSKSDRRKQVFAKKKYNRWRMVLLACAWMLATGAVSPDSTYALDCEDALAAGGCVMQILTGHLQVYPASYTFSPRNWDHTCSTITPALFGRDSATVYYPSNGEKMYSLLPVKFYWDPSRKRWIQLFNFEPEMYGVPTNAVDYQHWLDAADFIVSEDDILAGPQQQGCPEPPPAPTNTPNPDPGKPDCPQLPLN